MNTILSRFNLFSAILVIVTISIFSACKKDENIPDTPPPAGNPEELITTIKLIFTDSTNQSSVVTAMFKDPDGDGGNGPTVFDTIKLMPNKTYLTEIVLLDESKTPADSISNEVKEEANDHHFFFHPTGGNLTISYDDVDTNTPPLPLGLSTKWKTTTAGTGTIKIVLKHQPGVKNGTETPGETDIEVNFQVKVQ